MFVKPIEDRLVSLVGKQSSTENPSQVPLIIQAPVSRHVPNILTASVDVAPMPPESQAAVDELSTGHTIPRVVSVTVEESEPPMIVNIPVGETSHVAQDHDDVSVP
ncbi:hypothetical protein V6N12_070723 [Hibiscus sabdariffa]|uniref:Uncharacterized protein n=1 Tax=Hibiscus sabdariffa TaxID=183260 RepID=A0ABR2FI85_9ROSI